MSTSPLLQQLIDALCTFPGVGPKSAQRMAFHILQHNREQGMHLAKSLEQAVTRIHHCDTCRNFCETDRCGICNSPRREQSLLCVVESPADILAIEQSGGFNGRYFVLMGHISPIDGIGPKEIGIDLLREQLDSELLQEVILATSATVEGEATAQFIAQLAKSRGKKTSRIAHGIPMGSELEYLDGNTLSRALTRRDMI